TDAAKCGMLSTSPIIEAVAATLADHGVEKLVVDPVMVAKSGDPLLRPDARDALVKRILPLALVVTPNVPEAEVLAGMSVDSREAKAYVTRAIRDGFAAGHGVGQLRHFLSEW